MKAYVLHGVNKIHLEEIPIPSPGEGEVLIEVQAMGICGSDIPRIYQTGAYSHPLIPGHEFSGIVREAGAGADSRWMEKRVGIFPLIPCKTCGPCRKKQYELCRSYSYLGSRRDGGFAEYVRVPADNLILLPDSVSFEAAAMMEPMAVAVHAVRRAKPQKGETVAVCGLGTIGLLMVQFLMEAGIEDILVLGNKKLQEEMAEKLGVPGERYWDTRNAGAEEWLASHTGSAGVDVFFDCVGKNQVLDLAVKTTVPNGRIQLVGNPASDLELEKNIYWKVLRNQLTILGTWNSSFTRQEEDDWNYVLKRLSDGRIDPQKLITHQLSFEKLETGLVMMRDKAEEYIKVMGRR